MAKAKPKRKARAPKQKKVVGKPLMEVFNKLEEEEEPKPAPVRKLTGAAAWSQFLRADENPLTLEFCSFLRLHVAIQRPRTVVVCGGFGGYLAALVGKELPEGGEIFLSTDQEEKLMLLPGFARPAKIQSVPFERLIHPLSRGRRIDMLIIADGSEPLGWGHFELKSMEAFFASDIMVMVNCCQSRYFAREVSRKFRDRALWEGVDYPVHVLKNSKDLDVVTILKAPLAGERLHAARSRILEK